jgi:hypothetical protein
MMTKVNALHLPRRSWSGCTTLFGGREFAVWGHFFIANLIISIPFTILYFCLLAMIFNSGLQNPCA